MADCLLRLGTKTLEPQCVRFHHSWTLLKLYCCFIFCSFVTEFWQLLRLPIPPSIPISELFFSLSPLMSINSPFATIIFLVPLESRNVYYEKIWCAPWRYRTALRLPIVCCLAFLFPNPPRLMATCKYLLPKAGRQWACAWKSKTTMTIIMMNKQKMKVSWLI